MFSRLGTGVPVPTNETLEFLTLIFAGLGVMNHEPTSVIGGLFWAIALSLLAARLRSTDQSEGRRSFYLIVSVGVTVAMLGAMMADLEFVRGYIGDPPIQLVMAVLGFLSSWILRMILRIGRRLENRSEAIVDKVIGLPDEKDSK